MNFGRSGLTCYSDYVYSRLTVEVGEHAGPFHSSGANKKIILEQVNFVYIGPHSGGSPLVVSAKPLLLAEWTMICHLYCGLHSATTFCLQPPRNFLLQIR